MSENSGKDNFQVLHSEDFLYYDGPIIVLKIGRYPEETEPRLEILSYTGAVTDWTDHEGFTSIRLTREDVVKMLETMDRVSKEHDTRCAQIITRPSE